MQRKWQKATTAAVTSALLASQALMQAFAAGGTIEADLSTKTPVVRVVVPTKMAISVNEFEMGDTGSQIFSDTFTMKNVSEIPVNVKVTSTATLGANVTLVSTKAAAQDSTDTAKPAMWLAAVAAVNDNSGTFEYLAEGTDKTVGGLDGTEANATAFKTKAGAGTATQNFYLANATAAQYKAIIGSDAADIGNGADYYKLTEDTTITDNDTLAAVLSTQDIYTATTAPTAGTGEALTKIEKGDSSATFVAGKYYTMAAGTSDFATVKADASGVYLYIDSATTATGDAAAFRYAGALSSAKSGWSSADDLKAVAIQYDITGITGSAYEAIEGLTYGYKSEDNALTLVDGVLTAKIKVADFKDGTLTIGETTAVLNTKAGAWGGGDDAVTFTFNSTWADAMKGKTCIATINLNDGSALTASFDVPN